MSSSGQQSGSSQPKRFLQPCLLLLIAESPDHGYDLLERLAAFGFERDPGSLYRALRSMEGDGLVRSEWQLSGAGPGRRRYELTEDGQRQLEVWAERLAEMREIVETYLRRYAAVRQAPAAGRTGPGW